MDISARREGRNNHRHHRDGGGQKFLPHASSPNLSRP
jgi:hypothetical protein